MAEPRQRLMAAGEGLEAGADLLRVAQAFCSASSLTEFARALGAVVPSLFSVPAYGVYVIEPWTGNSRLVASANVSEFFLASYERRGREVDSLHAHLTTTGRAAYNLGLMSMPEWLEHPLYTRVKRLHDVRHEIQTPIISRDGIVGNINFGTSDPRCGFTPHQVRQAELLGRVAGVALQRIYYTESVERERDHAHCALDLLGAAVVISDARLEPRLNDAARHLLDDVVDADVQLQRLIARPDAAAGFSRHLEVELSAGKRGVLHGHSRSALSYPDTLITVLELEPDGGDISAQTLIALTPREREVALRVVDGASDRQIAQRLHLSPHTVRQHVKHVYRKLDVDSRVALTRLLLRETDSASER
jgi:DNA-binding CsgD family transcriptional regulator/GAF domain-containing protein